MGYDEYEANEERRRLALEILCQSKVLKPCEFHGDILLETGEPIASAYRMGNARFTADRLEKLFRTRREMTDEILAAFGDQGVRDGCPRCDKMREG